MNFNRAIILGNLTRDPEVRTLPNGQTVANFGVATNRIWKDQAGNKQQQVEFHNVAAFGRLGEICSQYLKRGNMVLIEGRIQTRSWQGQDGVKKYRTEIITENMQLGPKNIGFSGPSNSTDSSQTTAGNNSEIPTVNIDEEPPAESYGSESSNNKKEGEVNIEEIPF